MKLSRQAHGCVIPLSRNSTICTRWRCATGIFHRSAVFSRCISALLFDHLLARIRWRKRITPRGRKIVPEPAASLWDAAAVETELLVQADKLVGGSDAVLVIDDTTILKKGRHSVGVAPQYCSTVGKIANCQTLVSLTLARGEVPVMLSLRLFLPETWTSDRSRLKRAGVPVGYRKARTKSEIALAGIDRVIAVGVRFGCVLADAGYGPQVQFRNGLTARKLTWAVGIPRQFRVYPADVKMIWPVARRGPPRQYSLPDTPAVAAEDMLVQATWQTIW